MRLQNTRIGAEINIPGYRPGGRWPCGRANAGKCLPNRRIHRNHRPPTGL